MHAWLSAIIIYNYIFGIIRFFLLSRCDVDVWMGVVQLCTVILRYCRYCGGREFDYDAHRL